VDEYEYIVFHVDGGIGKNIAATAVAKSIKQHYFISKLVVVTAWPEVWVHNPDVYRVYKFGALPYFYDDFISSKKTKILRLEPYHAEDLLLKRKHLVEVWCDLFDVPCKSIQPAIYLGHRELIAAAVKIKKEGPILMVQTSGGADSQEYPYSWARDLPPAFAQDVVNLVKGQFSQILHLRRDNQPTLEGTTQVTGNLRELFCYISMSDKFLGIDSFMQHACAAFNKSATVSWIANSPTVFGYPVHTNIIASGSKAFRHRIDSYLEEFDWVGSRFHECPYEDIATMFNVKEVANTLLEPGTKILDNNGFLLN
jgi:hypothetical protein